MIDAQTEQAVRLSEERHRSLVVSMAEIVWTTDPSGQVIEDQPGWRAYTGQSREDLTGSGWLASVHPDSRQEALSAWAHAVSLGLPFETAWLLRRRDGEYRCFSIHAAPVRGSNGVVCEWIGCNIDITDRRQREEELGMLHAQAGGTLAQLERQGREMQILKNLSDTLQACNSREEAYPFIALAATELFSDSSGALAVPSAGARELIETATAWGQGLSQGLSMKADFAVDDCWALRRGRMHEPGAGTVCHHFRTEPGGPYACIPLAVRGEVSGLLSLRLADSQHLDEERRSALALFGNAVALGLSMLQLRETLERHSIRDPLTGLAGAEFSEAVLAREIRRARSRNEPFSIALLDINGFSQLKADYGSRAADGLLHDVGTLLRSAIGPLDLAARYDSQRLLLLLIGDDTTSLPRLQRICLDLQQQTYTYHGLALPPITVFAGLAESPRDGTTSEALMRAANQALRAARLLGRSAQNTQVLPLVCQS